LNGDLTLKGITKPVKLNVEHSGLIKDHLGREKVGFTVTGKIKRTDFGVNFGGLTEAGGLALGKEVKLNSEIQLVKQA
jgi:polyisoprenoid-binding protein YceI